MGGSRSPYSLATRLHMNAPKEERFPQFCGRVLHRSAMDTGSIAGPLRVDAVEKGLAIIGAPNPHSASQCLLSGVKRTSRLVDVMSAYDAVDGSSTGT